MLRAIPLFIIPLALYNILALSGGMSAILASELFSINLMSGAVWSVTTHDAFVLGGIILLYLEIVKATGTGMSSVMDHALSMLVFVVFLVEFLLYAECGTATFFALTLMSLLDVVAGFTVSIVAARRDFMFDGS
jgi:hypothetical protein